MHKDKGSYANHNLGLTKKEWEKIFGKPENVKVKKGKVERDDFTNGGLKGKNRGWC
jgi:hypothetical protein